MKKNITVIALKIAAWFILVLGVIGGVKYALTKVEVTGALSMFLPAKNNGYSSFHITIGIAVVIGSILAFLRFRYLGESLELKYKEVSYLKSIDEKLSNQNATDK